MDVKYVCCIFVIVLCVSSIAITEMFSDKDIACPKPCKCHISTVDCYRRRLTYIPKLPSNTTRLRFSGNHLPFITKNTFFNASSIRLLELELGYNKIRSIANDSFEMLPYLTFLQLSGNNLSSAQLSQAFYGLRSSELRELYLREMNIMELTENTFQYLANSSLQKIDFSTNFLKILNGSVFGGLRYLTRLNFYENKIKEVSWNGLQHLQFVTFRFNRFTKMLNMCSDVNSTFLPNLSVLDLGGNSIHDVDGSMFQSSCFPRLRNLSLGVNLFRYVPDNTFADLPSLKRLEMTWMRTQDLVFSSYAFNSSSLELLYINNHITNFYKSMDFRKIFTLCPNLKVLDMTNIGLEFTNSSGEDLKAMLSPLVNLKKLILQSTGIYSLPTGLFNLMPNLEILNFKYCKMSSWREQTFENMTSLKLLYMDGNRITMINETSFPRDLLHNIQHIALQRNPFSCLCNAFWFRQWVRDNHRKLMEYPKSYVCETPAHLKGKLFISYNPTYASCHPINPYIIYGASLGAVVLVLALLSGTLYRCRWHIKHYIYLMRARKGYERIPDGDDFTYDAFVAYNSSDRVWVISQLIPKLEKTEKLKLCLHDRDFDVGKLIVDNILDNIQRSRKTLLVLSNAFVKSHWCKFEMTFAHSRSIEDECNSMVVVMLEDIKSKYMSNSLHVLLKSTTYIPWTLNEEGKTLFWQRLVAALRKPVG